MEAEPPFNNQVEFSKWAAGILSEENKTEIIKQARLSRSVKEYLRIFEHEEGCKHYETLSQIQSNLARNIKEIEFIELNSNGMIGGFTKEHFSPFKTIMTLSMSLGYLDYPSSPISGSKISIVIEQLEKQISKLEGLLASQDIDLGGGSAVPELHALPEYIDYMEKYNLQSEGLIDLDASEIASSDAFNSRKVGREALDQLSELNNFYKPAHENAIGILSEYSLVQVLSEPLVRIKSIINSGEEYKVLGVKRPSKRAHTIRLIVYSMLNSFSFDKRYKNLALTSIKELNFYSLVAFLAGLKVTGSPYLSVNCHGEIDEAIRLWDEMEYTPRFFNPS